MKHLLIALSLAVCLALVGCCPGSADNATCPLSKGKSSGEKKEAPACCAKKDAPACCPAGASFAPTLFVALSPELYNPDGMTVCEKTGLIYLNVPNFNQRDENGVKKDSSQGGYLVEINKDGSFKTILEYPVFEPTGQTGPMGLDFGPDGNLYVCDNQYFDNADYLSRILRVVMKDGAPTGEVETVIEGAKLANAILWHKNKLFYTDTFLDTEDKSEPVWFGSGAVYMFDGDEVLAAGKDGKEPISFKATEDDPHCIAFEKVMRLGREDHGGADGMTVDSNDVIYFGNFGNGQLYAIYPDAENNYSKENCVTIFDSTVDPSEAGFPPFECCDGIFYDPTTDYIFINDSMENAIRYFAPVKQGEKAFVKTLTINDDTDGLDGKMDQPCECVIVDGKMIVASFDWPFPGLKNTKVDGVGTLSIIDISKLKPNSNKSEK